MRFLLTGSAGFIGFHLARRLLADGHRVVGFDGLTPYYDVSLKKARHAELETMTGFTPVIAMLEDRAALETAARLADPDVIIHLAAQAGVRYSLENPSSYVSSNITGSWSVLEVAREVKPKHLLLASTSSVYGSAESVPSLETDETGRPLTIYAASKRSMEVMAHSYAHLYGLPTTAFRFFTVYGPWGRPDMALFKFVDAILKDQPIDVYGEGQMQRDFTYIDDLVEAIVRLAGVIPATGQPTEASNITDTLSHVAPYRVVNMGGGRPRGLLEFIDIIEQATGRTAIRNIKPMQPGDVPITYASSGLLEALTGYKPATPLDAGVRAFVDWYRRYYAV